MHWLARVQASVFQTPSGDLSIRVGGHPLEDERDPGTAAQQFVQGLKLQDAENVVLLGAGLGYRLRELNTLGIKQLVVYEPSNDVFELAKKHAPERLSPARVFTDLDLLAKFLNTHTTAREKNTLLVPPSYKRAFPEQHKKLVDVMREASGFAILAQNSVSERSRLMIESTMQNLPLLSELPVAMSRNDLLKGRPAFIVSAGPSLDRNIHLLEKAGARGAVMVVNTAAPAVKAAGVRADAICGIESLDVREGITGGVESADSLLLDISAHPENFKAGMAHVPTMWFFPAQEAYRQLCGMTGANALPYGGSVATAAFSIAYNWGADPIVLLGQDLAYTDGRYYARNTPHEGLIAREEQGVIVVEGHPEWEEHFTRCGVKPVPRYRPRLTVDAWGGGTVNSTHDMVSFRRWFEEAARQVNAAGRRLINATEGGAHIPGFDEIALAEVLSQCQEQPTDLAAAAQTLSVVPAHAVNNLRLEIRRGAQEVLKACKRVQKAKSAHKRTKAQEDVRRAARRSPFVDAHAASGLIPILNDRELSPAERQQRTFAEIRSSAERVVKLSS